MGARVLGPEATVAAFPLGGIGTGNVSVGARGELRDWEISNHPDKGTWLPFTFFAIRACPDGGEAISRVLEARIPPPYEGDSGQHIGKVAGLPRLRSSRMRGEYPLLMIDFVDEVLPVVVGLTAFTPLVPLDVDRSSLPGAVLRYTVHNPTDRAVDVSIAGSLSAPVGIVGHNVFQMPVYDGRPSVAERSSDALRGLVFGTDLPTDHVRYGTAALTTPAAHATITPQWAVDFWQDGVQLFWDDFTSDGRLEPQPATLETNVPPEKLPVLRTGSLAVSARLQPGETQDVEFYLTWHTPNRPRAWNGMVGLPNDRADEIIGNHYARRYDDAWHVAEAMHSELPVLEAATRDFHRALFASTLPPEVVDAVSATLVVLRSTTCLLLDDGSTDGRFAAWEGSFDHAGSCEGTCTHVWGYAQTAAWLFPTLERSARRTEFGDETLPDGRMRFRSNAVFGNPPLEFHPAVDGQLASVIRLHREWRFSGDDAFLRELWPAARRALDYAFATWDSDADFVLDSQQHNTYDIEFYGENTLSNSIFYAALRAGARLADHLGEHDVATRWRQAAELGAERADAALFNGEFYIQRTDDVDAHRYQYGEGCLSDQLLGQTHAHLNDLGHLFPADHVRRAIAAVFAHNFRRDFTGYQSVQRTYALNDDRGLVLCSWPRGGRPRIPFVYSDEVWSGIEYQVATHLIYEGLVAEGLEIVRAVRDRHDGVRRNPWNEAECGNHYARSLASWGVLVALTGTQWDAPTQTLRIEPHAEALRDGAYEGFFSTGSGWGTCRADSAGASLVIMGGILDLADAVVAAPGLGRHRLAAPVQLRAGEMIMLDRDASG